MKVARTLSALSGTPTIAKTVFAREAESRGQPRPDAGIALPHRAGVEKHANDPVPVLERMMERARAADRGDVVLVPAAQRGRVAEREPLEQRRVAGRPTQEQVGADRAVVARVLVPGPREVARIVEIAAERRGCRAQLVSRGRVLACAGAAFPSLVVVEREDAHAGHLGGGRSRQRLELVDADATRHAHRRAEGKRRERLDRGALTDRLRERTDWRRAPGASPRAMSHEAARTRRSRQDGR